MNGASMAIKNLANFAEQGNVPAALMHEDSIVNANVDD